MAQPIPLSDHPFFADLDRGMHALGPDVRRTDRKLYVAYATRRQFVRVSDASGTLRLRLIDVGGWIEDPEGIARPDAGDYDHWRDMIVDAATEEELAAAMNLVRQAYTGSHRKALKRGDPAAVLRCTFPFPEQNPPAESSQACIHCPNADRAVLDLHALIDPDDPALLAAVESFARWVMAPRQEDTLKAVVRHAAELYTRASHRGTCVPKTVLFSIYKWNQFSGGYGEVESSEIALRAFARATVPCWPTGEPRALPPENVFRSYNTRYD